MTTRNLDILFLGAISILSVWIIVYHFEITESNERLDKLISVFENYTIGNEDHIKKLCNGIQGCQYTLGTPFRLK